MSLLQSILMWLSLVAAGVLSVVGFGIWCGQHQVFPGRRLLGAFRRLPWPVQFFLLAFSLHLIVHGSIKTNAVGEVEGDVTNRTASALTGGMVTATPSVQTPPVGALAVRCGETDDAAFWCGVPCAVNVARRGRGKVLFANRDSFLPLP